MSYEVGSVWYSTGGLGAPDMTPTTVRVPPPKVYIWITYVT